MAEKQRPETQPALAYSPDGTELATGSSDRSVRLWDTNAGKQLWCFDGR